MQHQAKQLSSNRTPNISEQCTKDINAGALKHEQRLRTTSSQFNALADKLINSINPDHTAADEAAKGYNLIQPSKSSKVLPLTNGKLTSAKQAKYLADQKKSMRDAERHRVGQSVQNVILREQVRDEQLQSRL